MPQLSYLHVIWVVILELYKWKWNPRFPPPPPPPKNTFKSGKGWRKKEAHQMACWWQLVFWICECLTSFGMQEDWTVWPAQAINHADRAASVTTDQLENDTGLCKAEQQYQLGPYGFFLLHYFFAKFIQNSCFSCYNIFLFCCRSDIVYNVHCCLRRGFMICLTIAHKPGMSCMLLALKSSASFWMSFLIKALRSKAFAQYAWLPPLQSTISCNLFI